MASLYDYANTITRVRLRSRQSLKVCLLTFVLKYSIIHATSTLLGLS